MNVGDALKFSQIGANFVHGASESVTNGFESPYMVYYMSSKAYEYLVKVDRWGRLKNYLDNAQYVYGESDIDIKHVRQI